MKYYIVDAFADKLFRGNPAGVCVLENELDTQTMQDIAAENNLCETAFVVKHQGIYGLRWFTPKVEISLCGHATLASAYVILNFIEAQAKEVRFDTKSGVLTVKQVGDMYEMDFPLHKVKPIAVTAQMEQAIEVPVLKAYIYADTLLLLLENEQKIKNVKPNAGLIQSLADHAVVVTAKGEEADFVSRFFAPNIGILEDPVTGSAHSMLAPFWAEHSGKKIMTAKQLSQRGGVLRCESGADRVRIAGKATLYLKGEIFIGHSV